MDPMKRIWLGMLVASIALTLGGVLSLAVLVAVYRRVSAASHGIALIGLALALMGAFGAVVHGGYDLANVLNPPAVDVITDAGLPSPVDPRGRPDQCPCHSAWGHGESRPGLQERGGGEGEVCRADRRLAVSADRVSLPISIGLVTKNRPTVR